MWWVPRVKGCHGRKGSHQEPDGYSATHANSPQGAGGEGILMDIAPPTLERRPQTSFIGRKQAP